MQERKVKTSELLRRLLKTASIKHFIKRHGNSMKTVPFHTYITCLCVEKETIPAHVIEKSGIERTYGHQLFNGRKNPSRDKVIQLAIGFGLNHDEAQLLLKMARRNPLYPRITRDAAVIHALHHQLPLVDLQATLTELSLPLIGEEGYNG